MAKTGIIKVAVIGAESTGKSALCENLAAHYQTAWVPEYARDHFSDRSIDSCTLSDLEEIAARQIDLEDERIEKAQGFLFCDTTLITLKIWAQLEFNQVPESIIRKLSKSGYHLYLLSGNDLPWQQDPLRQNKFSRDKILQMNIEEVKQTGTPYYLISGVGSRRLQNAIEIIEKYKSGLFSLM